MMKFGRAVMHNIAWLIEAVDRRFRPSFPLELS